MPSFVNLGAYVDEGTMVDTWATAPMCTDRQERSPFSVGIGGVLEPMQAGPTIIEDNCFIGARSEVVEGCIVREGSVLGMGVFIGKINQDRGSRNRRSLLWRSAALFGRRCRHHAGQERSRRKLGSGLYCAVIVKRVDEKDPLQDLDQRIAACRLVDCV